MNSKIIACLGLSIASLFSCSKSDVSSSSSTSTTTTSSTSSGTDISVLKTKFYSTNAFNSSVSVSTDGNYLVIKTNGIPDHKSPYFGKTDARYEAYNGTNTSFSLNPNSISTQSLTFRIPLNPASASTKSSTPLGPMGVSINGVPFYNQYAAGGVKLTSEINSFDQYNGHPQNSGQYHYHEEPASLTKSKGSDAFLGLLLDGFPVYGPVENGKTILNSDLDTYHGHTSSTPEFPNGIYHYHVTSTDPYINGSGFYGTAGTVSQ